MGVGWIWGMLAESQIHFGSRVEDLHITIWE